MEILSVTNKKTQLHKSASDLSVKCINENGLKQTVSSDVSFFMSSLAQKAFVQVHKPNFLEVWRIKSSKDGKDTFDRVKKVTVDGIQAIACAKSRDSNPEYAIGYTTGQIKILELNSKNTTKVEFPGDAKTKASVVSLDYSKCGAYLSSVYEDGIINIYGLTTRIKSDTILLDKNSSVARFHPAKRYLLGVASYSGTVTAIDISTKKINFQQKEAHDAPCSDLAMSEDSPNFLFTCGCDSFIKIFDLRKKTTGLQVSSHCGLTAIAVSKSGEFIAVGNLKGDLLTYDIRTLKQPLAKKRIDNERITRIAFMPTWSSETEQCPTLYESAVSDELPDLPESNDDFTMEDIIGFQKGRISEFDLSCASRVSTFSTRDREGARASENFARSVGNALNDLSFASDMSFAESNQSEIDDRNVNVERLKRFSGGKKDSVNKRRSSYMPSPLQLIREEVGDKENHAGALNSLRSPSLLSMSADGPRFSSTPMTVVKASKSAPPSVVAELSNEVIDVDALDSSNKEDAEQQATAPLIEQEATAPLIEQEATPTIKQTFPEINIDFKKEFDALHDKIHFEVQSLNMDLNGRHMEMMAYIHNQRVKLQSRIQMIEECMGILMNDDVKINRIIDLQAENLELRQQLDNVIRSVNH